MKLTIDRLSRDLYDEAHSPLLGAEDETDGYLDVRLHEDNVGSWWIATGSADYDSRHGDACSAGFLPVRATRKDCRNIARDLIEELRDLQAQRG